MAVPQLAFGADKIWTGTTDTDWGTNTNWTGGHPGAGDDAVFNSSFSNQPLLGSNQSVGGIWMTTGIGQNVTISASTGFTLTLQGTTINGTSGLGILVDNTNGSKLTISAPVVIGNNQAWTNNSNNVFTISTGGLDLGNGKVLTINGTGDTTISGVVSNSGSLIQSGTGTLTLSGAKPYTGATTVSGGILNVKNATALGTIDAGTTVTDNNGDIFAINYADNGDGGLVPNDISLTVLTVVPEPSTWIWGALGLAAIGFRVVKRRLYAQKRENVAPSDL